MSTLAEDGGSASRLRRENYEPNYFNESFRKFVKRTFHCFRFQKVLITFIELSRGRQICFRRSCKSKRFRKNLRQRNKNETRSLHTFIFLLADKSNFGFFFALEKPADENRVEEKYVWMYVIKFGKSFCVGKKLLNWKSKGKVFQGQSHRRQPRAEIVFQL